MNIEVTITDTDGQVHTYQQVNPIFVEGGHLYLADLINGAAEPYHWRPGEWTEVLVTGVES